MLQGFLYFVVFGTFRLVLGRIYCDPNAETGTNSFNFSCLEECYFNFPSSCDFSCQMSHPCKVGLASSWWASRNFVSDYLELRQIADYPLSIDLYTAGRTNIVDIFNTPPETVISMNSEVDLRFSFNKLINYSCNVTVKTFNKENDFIKKCFHYTPK